MKIKCSSRLFYRKLSQALYLHPMDFYKLTDFQLYSILNSRHLDKENKERAERELERRHLSEEDLQKLADELTEKTKKVPSSFAAISPNALLLIGAVVLIFLMKQCVVSH